MQWLSTRPFFELLTKLLTPEESKPDSAAMRGLVAESARRWQSCARTLSRLRARGHGARLRPCNVGGTMMRAILVACLLCLSVAAFAGQPDAYSAGVAAYQAHDYTAALIDFKVAAMRGDARAQYIVGSMYFHGKGTAQDYAIAAKWCALAARKGFAPAQNVLGVMYQNGLGI